ncbi:MAG: Asp-tRNA(Asn)/Glu-tRNA(Gln) amidotransferase subunit GatC [Candidimonas sp.]|nr:MAG: Asp-tRNA(Asn)/Glu-tRNA(Gln) amidotransferase subunit GatC [Candidimonas sp.]
MAISDHDIAHIARLACLELSASDTARARTELDGILELIQQLQAVDTTGIEPMAHPLSAHQDVALRLRDDHADAARTPAQRDAFMRNAPARDNGLFLVPTVIE